MKIEELCSPMMTVLDGYRFMCFCIFSRKSMNLSHEDVSIDVLDHFDIEVEVDDDDDDARLTSRMVLL
jgi:hypothetical protein